LKRARRGGCGHDDPPPVGRGLSMTLAFLPPWTGYLCAGPGLLQDPATLRALGVGILIEFLARIPLPS
jgi:hypothetical protein